MSVFENFTVVKGLKLKGFWKLRLFMASFKIDQISIRNMHSRFYNIIITQLQLRNYIIFAV